MEKSAVCESCGKSVFANRRCRNCYTKLRYREPTSEEAAIMKRAREQLLNAFERGDMKTVSLANLTLQRTVRGLKL